MTIYPLIQERLLEIYHAINVEIRKRQHMVCMTRQNARLAAMEVALAENELKSALTWRDEVRALNFAEQPARNLTDCQT